MNPWHDDVGRITAGGNALRPVVVAAFRETAVSSPAVGSDRRTGRHCRLDERHQAPSGDIVHPRHADPANAASLDFGCDHHDRLLVCLSPCDTDFPATHISFVDLNVSIQEIAPRSYHGAPQLMEPAQAV